MSATLTESVQRPAQAPSIKMDDPLRRIQGEYREMPGLSVTAAQAQRLWALDRVTCSLALTMLVQRGILRRTPSGTYVRG